MSKNIRQHGINVFTSSVRGVHLFGILAIKALLLFTFRPFPGLSVLGKPTDGVSSPTYWIYEQSVQEYIMQDAFYVELAEGQKAEEVFGNLQRQGMIDSYEQPLLAVDVPHYRVHFTTRSDVAKRTIALLLSQGKLQQVEGVPVFWIQQPFGQKSVGYYEKLIEEDTNEPKREYDLPLVHFTTQQVEHKNFEWQWYLDDIGLTKDEIGCLTPKIQQKVKVAVIDNAFMSNHPNIYGSVVQTIDVTDNDTNVLPPVQDEGWMHGSHSAGLIAGKKVAGKGIAGTSLGGAELYLIKATEDTASSDAITHGIEAFAKAVELNVDVISLSRGAYMDFPVFRKVVQKAIDKGIVVIAAAGNYGSDELFYPAAYEPVIAVGSVGVTKRISSFSNFGPWVDVYAPGEDLVVPNGRNDYAKTDGTSAAAPLFAGVYTLLYRLTGEKPGTTIYAQPKDTISVLRIHNLCSADAAPTQTPPKEQIKEQEPAPQPTENIKPVFAPQQQHTVAPEPTPVVKKSLEEILIAFVQLWGGRIVAAGVVLIALAVMSKKKASSVQE